MSKRIIFGVLITNRLKEAPEFQKLITEYGCNIKTRLGLHNVSDSLCSVAGLVLLEMFGDEERINELEQKIREFEGLELQKMVFEE